ncbi:hypothetical protein VTO73DRAFT_13969 [Trametes versicolor]
MTSMGREGSQTSPIDVDAIPEPSSDVEFCGFRASAMTPAGQEALEQEGIVCVGFRHSRREKPPPKVTSIYGHPLTIPAHNANCDIGLEIVKQPVAVPTNSVIAVCRNPDKVTTLTELKSSAKGALHIVQLDVPDFANVSTLWEQLDAILGTTGFDYLISNAGSPRGCCCSSSRLWACTYTPRTCSPFGAPHSHRPTLDVLIAPSAHVLSLRCPSRLPSTLHLCDRPRAR